MSPNAKLIVTMPREGNVVAHSGDGSIRVDHVHGRLDLKTGDGSIRATDIGGQLTLSTGDGSVTVDDVAGDSSVDTGDGSVSVAGKLDAVKLHTSDGSITFRAAAGTSMKDDWSMTTGDGGVALYLPSDFGADLDAHTGDGIDPERSEDRATDGDRDSERRCAQGRARRRRQASCASAPATASIRLEDQLTDRRAAGTPSDLRRRLLETHPFAPGTCCSARSAVRPSAACRRASAPAARRARSPFESHPPCAVPRTAPRSSIGASSPSERARDIAVKNAGVASGNGLPASVPSSSRPGRAGRARGRPPPSTAGSRFARR